MELYAKGQLSYLILNCLLERDFYGLDIITEIDTKSCGKVKLKKPSVYSNLTRMEKQGYVSSYMKTSELGPNRKYYSITSLGRSFYNEIDYYFKRNNIDVFSEFSENAKPQHQVVTDEESDKIPETTDDDFFDFSSVEKQETSQGEENQEIDETLLVDLEEESSPTQFLEQEEKLTETQIENVQQSSNLENNDNYAFSIKNALLANKDESKDIKDDAVFLNKQEIFDYNQKLYDISKDIKSYKKKKSFAEDQISIVAEAPLLSSSIEKKKANLEDFKKSLIQNKNTFSQNQDSYSRFANNFKDKSEITEEKDAEEIVKDDGKFIVAHIDSETIEKPRKIEPPRLQILPNAKEKLPAPKRDSSIDPSHKEILSQLYAKTKGSSNEEQREDALYDYNDLKDFYKNQNISFDVYEKPSVNTAHNTNKLYFIASIITFLCASVCSVLTFVTLFKLSMLNEKFNFLYIVLPSLMLIDVFVQAYNMSKYKSWLPKQILPQWQIWTMTGGFLCLCVGLNFAFGLAVNDFAIYATTLLLPSILILAIIPVRYYLKRYLLIKKWK